MSVQGRRKIPKYRPEEIGIPPIWTFPEDHVTSTHPEQLDDSSPTAVPPLDEVESKPNRAAKGRNPRPSLPHFNDRVQGSHWDLPFSLLHTLLNRHENTTEDLDDRRVVAQAKQTLEYWENAARSRGDHLVVAAVGKNGTLGPSVS
nr:hypothetical protein BN887_04283 [Melanopsichium pennsylvanicum 4]